MNIAFIVSTQGDTALALKTIQELQTFGHQISLIALTDKAEELIAPFSAQYCEKVSLRNLLPDTLSAESYFETCIEQLTQYLQQKQIKSLYIGVPSADNELPYLLANAMGSSVSVLLAYEHMFQSKALKLWAHLPDIAEKSNIHIGIPVPEASQDFTSIPPERLHVTGHISIDLAYNHHTNIMSEQQRFDTRQELHIYGEDSFVFVTGSTQPPAVDKALLECVLNELPNHPHIQVRFGIHPGIQDQNLTSYLNTILAAYETNPCPQFKMILTQDMSKRLQVLSYDTTHTAFIQADITGSVAQQAADRVAQAVSGALVTQAALEGKPAYTHETGSYLPYFAGDMHTFFTQTQQARIEHAQLQVPTETTPVIYAQLLNH